jgi:hypothetical protein
LLRRRLQKLLQKNIIPILLSRFARNLISAHKDYFLSSASLDSKQNVKILSYKSQRIRVIDYRRPLGQEKIKLPEPFTKIIGDTKKRKLSPSVAIFKEWKQRWDLITKPQYRGLRVLKKMLSHLNFMFRRSRRLATEFEMF